jgi:hypothetical protein
MPPGAATGARKVVLLSHKLLCLILGAVSCLAVWRAPAFVATAWAADEGACSDGWAITEYSSTKKIANMPITTLCAISLSKCS